MTKLHPLPDSKNAYSLTFDPARIYELAALSEQMITPSLGKLDAGKGFDLDETREGVIADGVLSFFFTNIFSSSLYWVSCNNWATYDIFKTFFNELDIEAQVKEHVDCNEKVVMYCGFIMASNHADTEHWHADYFKGANAFTLICPLTEPDEAHGGLLYSGVSGETKAYHYRLGEAIVFGEGFEHSTEPFQKTQQPRTLLSITFGTDKMRHWPVLRQTVGDHQSKFFVLPCGHQYGTCQCVIDNNSDGRISEALEWARLNANFYDYEIIADKPWSQTLRLVGRSGPHAYLKILSTSRRHEAEVSAVLSTYFPHFVAKVLAHDAEAGWLLLADHCGDKHDPRSLPLALARVSALAQLEAKAVHIPELLQVIPKVQLHLVFQDLCHCLWPERSPNTSDLCVNTYAHQFFTTPVAQNYWLALKEHEDFFTHWLNALDVLPHTLTHGDFQYDNAALLANDQTILYDWGDAVLGPAGLSLSNPLFLDDITVAFSILKNMHTAPVDSKFRVIFDAIRLSITQVASRSGGKERAYAQLLEKYIEGLVENGYGERQAIIRALPASLIAGNMRWLVSWCVEENYSQPLREFAGQWWSNTLDRLLELARTSKYRPIDQAKKEDNHQETAQESSLRS